MIQFPIQKHDSIKHGVMENLVFQSIHSYTIYIFNLMNNSSSVNKEHLQIITNN